MKPLDPDIMWVVTSRRRGETFRFALEDDSGSLLLETSGYLILEAA
tara:strand:+ start:10384 stop:10521 length:138 start_codon:yes stop_codon:yes gene_type:complete